MRIGIREGTLDQDERDSLIGARISAATNRYKPDAVLKFMEDILPRLERLDFVERYAWFPAKQENPALGTSALFDESGKLTKLGECYRDA